MSHAAATLVFIAIFVVAGVAAYLAIRLQARTTRERERLHRHQTQLELMLHPLYQQKVASDRSFLLAQEKHRFECEIKRAEFALKHYTAMHRVPAEMYLLNEDYGQLTALPSLKTAPEKVLPGGSVDMELPSAPRFAEIVGMISREAIPLCWSIDGPKMGTFRHLLSTGLIGRPERGKTTALLHYVCMLLMIQAEIWVWDIHGSMSELSGLNYFDSFDSILDSIPYLAQELQERDALYHESPRRIKHPLVLLVDEVPALVGRYESLDRRQRQSTPSPLRTIRPFVLEARKWNGFAFVSGQSLPVQVLPSLDRDNLSSRIVFECSPEHARQMGLPKTAIDTMLPRLRGAERGTHIADYSTWSQPELADIPYTDESDLAWVLERRQNRQSEVFSPLTERSPCVRQTGPLGESGESQVRVDWKRGESGGENGKRLTNEVRVSPQERETILAAARAQLAATGREKVVISKLIESQPGWNNKWWPKIKQVLDEEGL